MEGKFNCVLHSIGDAETTKNGNLIQKVVVKVPARINEFQEQIGEDQIFQITIFKKEKIDAFWKDNLNDKLEPIFNKMKLEVYINSNYREYEGKDYFNIELNFKSVTWIK